MKAGRDPVLRHEFDEFIPQRVNNCVPWNGTKTLNQSALKVREMPKPTAHKAVGIVWNFEQDRQQREMHQDRDCGRVSSRRFRSSRGSGQTRISSLTSYVVHASDSYHVNRDNSRWRSNCCERPIGVTPGIWKAEKAFPVNESIEFADQISSNVDRYRYSLYFTKGLFSKADIT